MKYLSLFSGIGGFELGIQKVYVATTNGIKNGKGKGNTAQDDEAGQGLESTPGKNPRAKKRRLSKHDQHSDNERKFTCVGYSEIDKYATQIYQKHFPEHKNYGDITKINEKELPDFDFLCGGFPCQSFSIAGKRRGFTDTRGTLFFDIARILKAKQPSLLLLENVKGLLSHDEGRTFATIIATLDELGYDLQWQVLNSKNHGVPQNRERVFIVGNLRGTPRPKVFPFTGETETATGDIFVDESQWRREGKLREYKGVSPTLNTNGGGGHLPLILQKSQDWREKGTLRKFRNVAPTIRANMGDNHPMIMQRGRGKNKGGLHEISPTVSSNSFQDNNHLITGTIRRLTPTECERLQGFPDGWTEGQSDTQRYKCLGNAVTVNVIKAIVQKLI